MAQKSLFAYFKSPKPEKQVLQEKGNANKAKAKESNVGENTNGQTSETPKRKSRPTLDDHDEIGSSQKRKRVRVIESDSDDSDTELQLNTSAASETKTYDSSDLASTPKSTLKTISPRSETNFGSVGKSTKDKLSSFTSVSEAGSTPVSEGYKYHQSLEFLKLNKIRDKERRLRTDEGYDCRTLYVPQDFKQSVTPAMRQWWELKEDHFDTILFFKMGKFYEFFHMDADVGVKELGLTYMKGGYAHAGFPEIGYSRYADSLLRKGYKIARIEQTETPDMMNDRLEQSTKKLTKFDKVVKREVCQITTPGTRTPNFLDGENIDVSSNYLLALCDKSTDKGLEVGVCFVDTSIGKVHLGQFEDDIYGSRLRTLVAHYVPGQILCEKRKQSALFASLFQTTLSSVMKEYLAPSTEFWTAEKTIKYLAESDYFENQSKTELPETLKSMISDSDSLARTAKDGYELAFKSLGAVVWYLGFCFLDYDVLSLKCFEEYIPLDVQVSHATDSANFQQMRMVLDSVTLTNLDIFCNQFTGTMEGSLLEQIDKCKTAGGRRLLREWLAAPLCCPKLINARLDAIADLMSFGDLTALKTEMKKLPDFERLLSRIHSLGHKKRSETHPDSRAIMFENEIYSKRKIESFLTLLEGFKQIIHVTQLFESLEIRSIILKRCVTLKCAGGQLPDIAPILKYFGEAFDQAAAKKAGAIHPTKGYVTEYDEATSDIEDIKDELERYLKSQKTLLHSNQVSYVGTARNRFQLEVPDSASKRVPSSYEVSGQRKGFRRYVTPETKSLLAQMMDAEDRQVAALKDTMRKIFQKFCDSYDTWMEIAQCMNVLDVLMSLTDYAMTNEGIMCRPEIVLPQDGEQPYLEILDGRHPSSVKTFGGGQFIPNDTFLGCVKDGNNGDNKEAELLLLTGPNMGGKSTLMRQVALISIMSQLGSYVPADKCRLTPIDRVFTRLGASDRIMHGESTFFVELSETSIILQHGTQHSLVLLDELGRGTATHDGTAIASAVVRELAERLSCRAIFSTHYHCLVDDFLHHQHVQLGHMACLVSENDEGDGDAKETITFLYKLAPEHCPKSYGFNVARLAGLPDSVIKLGLQKAQELENTTKYRQTIRSILASDNKDQTEKVRSLIAMEV